MQSGNVHINNVTPGVTRVRYVDGTRQGMPDEWQGILVIKSVYDARHNAFTIAPVDQKENHDLIEYGFLLELAE